MEKYYRYNNFFRVELELDLFRLYLSPSSQTSVPLVCLRMLTGLYRRIRRFLRRRPDPDENEGSGTLRDYILRAFGPVLGLVILARLGAMARSHFNARKIAFSDFQHLLESVRFCS